VKDDVSDVVEYLHGTAPDPVCVRCLVTAYPVFDTPTDLSAFLGVLIRRGEPLSVTHGHCVVCSKMTTVVRSNRGDSP
jgi:hypothetical protein